MSKYTAANGTEFTSEDIERWAHQSEEGYTGGHLGSSNPGRPVSIGEEARPFTLRLDATRRAKLNRIARDRHTSASQVMRDLIDEL
ncbi:MAG: CopG family transcriptional regulator [Mycobacteriaceae bacterium]|uniref:CopG family transcriptional regulator n=1 Tax=Corynebacterium sp. TaxID=1720 RepID=UPI003F95D395